MRSTKLLQKRDMSAELCTASATANSPPTPTGAPPAVLRRSRTVSPILLSRRGRTYSLSLFAARHEARWPPAALVWRWSLGCAAAASPVSPPPNTVYPYSLGETEHPKITQNIKRVL